MNDERKTLWGGHLIQNPAQQNVQFCAGRDVREVPMADEILLPFDIWTNRAHCIMLEQCGLIQGTHLTGILNGLRELEDSIEKGTFRLKPELEDVHTNVEVFVSEAQGADAGGRMHIGRSRNDQSACDMRLYLRSRAIGLFEEVKNFAETLLGLAEEHTGTVMPGFTHYQPAMITSWGHWLCAYVQGLCRDLERLGFTLRLVNRNPLGAAAGFGSSWPLNRELTTELLGFDRVESNSLDCIVSRWENEAQLAHAFSMLMNRLSVISQDLIILSLPYLKMVRIDDGFVTGSSIMPQKKNPDFAEVIRSKAAFVQGQLQSLLGIQKGALSGYNRDTQWTKYLIMDVVRECEDAPGILREVYRTLEVDMDAMRRHCQSGFMNAVDLADLLCRENGLAFREAHNIIARAVKLSSESGSISADSLKKAFQESGRDPQELPENIEAYQNPTTLIEARKHTGSPSPEQVRSQIGALHEELESISKPMIEISSRAENAWQRCRNVNPG